MCWSCAPFLPLSHTHTYVRTSIFMRTASHAIHLLAPDAKFIPHNFSPDFPVADSFWKLQSFKDAIPDTHQCITDIKDNRVVQGWLILASPWFPWQKPNGIYSLAFRLLQKINCDQQTFVILKRFQQANLHKWTPLLNQRTTPPSHDVNISITKLPTCKFI